MTVYRNEGRYDTSNVVFHDGEPFRKTARGYVVTGQLLFTTSFAMTSAGQTLAWRNRIKHGRFEQNSA